MKIAATATATSSLHLRSSATGGRLARLSDFFALMKPRVMLLVDARHGLKPFDIEAMKALDETAVSYQIVLTKSDKLKTAELGAVIRKTAIALWDARAQRLVLARDRVGIRPLFYAAAQGRLLFASEAKALFAVEGMPRKLDPMGLAEIFTYWAPVGERSVFAGLKSLPPGHLMVAERGQLRTQRYWDWQFPEEPVEAAASADEYADTVAIFKNAGESASFFGNSYGYAVFPTVGKGGLGVGAAHGSGRMYAQGKQTGTVKMTQVSVGFQAGGQAFSQIVFLQDKRAYDEFTKGNFEFDATVQAVAITASATASAARRTTVALTSSASSGERESHTTAPARLFGITSSVCCGLRRFLF